MPLSDEERQALRDRAAGLRAELTSQTARRQDAEYLASQSLEDQRLLAEVATLESQVAEATASADRAEGSVKSAAEAMRRAAARQSEAVRETDPTGSSPATPATDNTTPDQELQGDILTADLAASDTSGEEGSK